MITVIFFDLGNTLVTSAQTWLPGAKALLLTLKEQSFRLGILSNTGNMADRQAILNLLPADFDITMFEPALVLFSSEVGLEKPDKAIFAEANARANLPAHQCLYCSEDIVETLVAQHIGMRSIRVQSSPNNDLGVIALRIEEFQSRIGN